MEPREVQEKEQGKGIVVLDPGLEDGKQLTALMEFAVGSQSCHIDGDQGKRGDHFSAFLSSRSQPVMRCGFRIT